MTYPGVELFSGKNKSFLDIYTAIFDWEKG